MLLVQTILFADFVEIDSPERTALEKFAFPSIIGKASFEEKTVFWRIYPDAHNPIYRFYYQDEEGISIDQFFSSKELSALDEKGCASVKFKHGELPVVGFSCRFGDSAYFRSSEKNIVDIVLETRFGGILFCYDIEQNQFFEKSDGTRYIVPPEDEVAENLFRIRLLKKHGLFDISQKEKLPIGIAGLKFAEIKDLSGNEFVRLVEAKKAVVRNRVWEALSREADESLKTPINQELGLSVNINGGVSATQAKLSDTGKYVLVVSSFAFGCGFFLWRKLRSRKK